MSDTLRDLVDYLARSLVDEPSAVSVAEVGEADAYVYELRVAKDDLGKVIGKKGTTARAIRTVLFAAANKANRRAVLNIVEE